MPTATAPPSPAPLLAALRAEQPRASAAALAQTLARRYAPWLGAPDVPVFAASRAPGTLVRWRCMLQDTGLGRELVRAADCWRVEAGDGDDDDAAAASDSQLAERAVVYACDVPGWSAWARRSWQRGAAAAADVGADDAAEAMRNMALGDEAPAYLDKHPQREQPGAGALLKIYDDELADSLRVTQCVDVLGVLDSSALPGADWADADGSAGSSTPLVPALHVLALAPVDLRVSAAAPSEAQSAGAAEARQEISAYLKDALAGDELAAEWTLLALLARIHSRRGPLLLGSLSLNLSGATLPHLHGALQALLPSVLRQSLALPHLNEARTRMAPSNDGAGEGLRAGRLQCVDGTALLIDETEMGEGTLGDRGVRNIRELSAMLTSRKLAYNFSYSTFDFDVDAPVVVLSTGKSLLPIDVWLPTSPSASTSAPAAASEEQLSRWRTYVATARSAELAIPEQVAQQIQDEFVAARKEGQAGFKEGQEALLRRMGVARFVALSNGLSEMDLASWRRAVELDELRMTRVAAAGSATAAAAANGSARPSAANVAPDTPERRREARTSGDTLGSPPQP